MNNRITVYTDGGARGNPGPAGAGVYSPQMGEFHKYLGTATNNQAEYTALLMAITEAVAYKEKHPEIDEVECFLDSELVVKQMNREYKVKNEELQKIFVKIWNLTIKFKKVTFTHVRREYNKDADRLVNVAIDGALK
ncbi:MAG: ribonuclease HI family protein [bacterium]|nr:ribonuclease HI family protein [bacterium]